MEPQDQLTVDNNVFSVLQDSIPSRHLHRDRADAFPGERARQASLQGDNWLLGEGKAGCEQVKGSRHSNTTVTDTPTCTCMTD